MARLARGQPTPTYGPILWFVKPYKIGATIADNVLRHGVGTYCQDAFLAYTNTPENVLQASLSSAEAGFHPTQKPLRLLQALIALTTREGQLMLDPFAGSGSTLVAAQSLARPHLGVEAQAEYVAICKRRLREGKRLEIHPLREGLPPVTERAAEGDGVVPPVVKTVAKASRQQNRGQGGAFCLHEVSG